MTRGRKPKPTALKVAEGNPGKRPLNDAEPQYDCDLGAPPVWLTPHQQTIWKNVCAEAAKGLLKSVDEAVVVQYCVSYSILQECNASMAARGGSVYTDLVTGEVCVAPEVQVIQKQHVVLLRAASEMGFTPSSRSRLHLEDPKDPDNPFENL